MLTPPQANRINVCTPETLTGASDVRSIQQRAGSIALFKEAAATAGSHAEQ